MATITVSDAAYARLAGRAAADHTTVDVMVEMWSEATAGPSPTDDPAGGPRHLSDEVFDRVAAAMSTPLPPTAVLPHDFSRADVYLDHD